MPKVAGVFGARPGQALVIIAAATFFVLITVTAVALDGANWFLTRRQLQLAADSAALAGVAALRDGADTSQAWNVAYQYVISNTTGLNLTLEPLTPLEGAGSNLTRGIEVTDDTVRVALKGTVRGLFTELIGIDSFTIHARAMAGFSGTGLLPIAVRRYDKFNTPKTDYVANQTVLGQGWGWDQRSSYATQQWWPQPHFPGTPLEVWIPQSPYASGPPSGGTPGPEVPILGAGVATNNGASYFNGFINLDIRQITAPPTEYLSGVTPGTNPQTLKDLESSYIKTGYRNPRVPQVGDQIAVLNGVSNAFTAHVVKEFYKAGYTMGSIVPVIIYDGIVWERPGYTVQACAAGVSGCSLLNSVPSTVTAEVSYNVTISPDVQSPDLNMYVTVEVFPLPDTDQVEVTLPSNPVFVPSSGRTFQVKVKQKHPHTNDVPPQLDPPVVAVVRLRFEEANTHIVKYASVVFRSASTPSEHVIMADPGEVLIDTSGQHGATVTLYSMGVNGYSASGVLLTADMSCQPGLPSWLNLTWNPASQKLNIANGSTRSATVTLTSSPQGQATGDYLLCIRHGDNSHYTTVTVKLRSPWQDPPAASYVVVQGYANVMITRYGPNPSNPNTVFGQIVSPIVPSFAALDPQGRMVRLMDWR